MLSEAKIRALMGYFGVKSVKQLEIQLGLSNGYISNLQKKGTENPGRMLVALNENGISADWFFSVSETMVLDRLKKQPNDEKKLHQKVENATSPPMPETAGGGIIETPRREALVVVDGGVEQGVLIPVIDQGFSAGLGFDYEDGEIIRYVKIPAWIARSGRNLAALPIYGDSMEPTISGGDLAVCDSGGFRGDGLYMLRDEERGLTFCKRLIWAPSGWTIKSDNPSYEPMRVDGHAIEVIARVIAAVKEVK